MNKPTMSDLEKFARLIYFMVLDEISAEDALSETNDAHWEYWSKSTESASSWAAASAIMSRIIDGLGSKHELKLQSGEICE